MAKAKRKIRLSRWDAADHLKNGADIAAYLQACAEEDDPALMIAALGDVARARNMMQPAKQAGLSRGGLYKALARDSNPSFATVAKVAKALGFRFMPTRI